MMREHAANIAVSTVSGLLVWAVTTAIDAYEPPAPSQRHVWIGTLVPPPPRIAEPPPPPPEPSPVDVHRRILQDASRLNAPAALYQGQVYVESRYRTDAVSPAGAVGAPQFLLPTWEKDVRPRLGPECADAPRTDAECSFRGQVEYLDMIGRWLPIDANHDVRMAAYNAGAGNVGKEQQACAMRPGCDPSRWTDHVETVCLRRASACRETRDYVPRIHRAARQFAVTTHGRDVEASLSFSW